MPVARQSKELPGVSRHDQRSHPWPELGDFVMRAHTDREQGSREGVGLGGGRQDDGGERGARGGPAGARIENVAVSLPPGSKTLPQTAETDSASSLENDRKHHEGALESIGVGG